MPQLRATGRPFARGIEGRLGGDAPADRPFVAMMSHAPSGDIWRRDYLQPMLDSTTGLLALGGATFLLGVGIFWLSKIVKVDV